MFKNINHKLGNILLRPFREYFLFMIAFFILATSPYFLRQFFTVKLYFNALLLSIHCIVLSYFVTLVISLIKLRIIRIIVQAFIMVFAIMSFALNFYCVFKLGYLFDSDFALLLLDTNPKESKEFLTTMIPGWIILTISGVYLFFLIFWLLSERFNLNLRKKTSQIALIFMCLCVAAYIISWKTWREGPIKSLIDLPQFEVPDKLQSYYTHPQINVIDTNTMPANVILIIGESFARSHSSLYNYDKITNPQLSSYQENSLLYTFDSIDAPAATTSESIKLMMSTYCKQDSNKSKLWYEYTSLIELMQVCGFDCYWFTNQARGSKHNGIARTYAQACNAQWFLQEEGSERRLDGHKNLDIVLVDSSYFFINHLNSQCHNFIIYHMEGSHFDYSKRYTKEFDYFHEQDYINHPPEHRIILATYDNSILYNDYIVAQIMNLYKNKEAIVIYVPDHGQVMYRNPNNPNYYVHGNDDDPISYALGVEIPFFVYASPLYQQKHPEMMERIKYRQDNPKTWNSDNLPYFIMDLIGVKEINGENIKPKSVLN